MNEPTGYTALDLVGFSDKGNYSNSATYVQNDLVHYSGNLWKCLVDDTTNITPAENANWTLWIGEPTNLMEAIIAPIEHSPATVGHSVGDQLIWNDVLYKVVAPIAIGDTLTVNTNIVAARKIVYQISGLESDIATIEPVATASQNYSVGDFLFYDWDLYKVTAAITSGDPIVTSGGSANVEAVTVGDELKALKNHVTQTDSNLAYVEEGNTATRNYSKGDYCVVGGILRKVIATNGILSGVGFTEGSNISAGEHLADEVSALNQSIADRVIKTATATLTSNSSGYINFQFPVLGAYIGTRYDQPILTEFRLMGNGNIYTYALYYFDGGTYTQFAPNTEYSLQYFYLG